MSTKCFNVISRSWGDIPAIGDYKYYSNILYKCDGKQWRKCCLICDKTARPLYCNLHNPKYNIDKPCGHSKLSCKVFDELSKELKCDIIHSHINAQTKLIEGFEFQIPGTKCKVDGFIPGTSIVFEVLGDFWHGNPNKPDDTLNKVTKQTYELLRQKTFQRFEKLNKLGYRVFFIWEHNIHKMQKGSSVFNQLTEFNKSII